MWMLDWYNEERENRSGRRQAKTAEKRRGGNQHSSRLSFKHQHRLFLKNSFVIPYRLVWAYLGKLDGQGTWAPRVSTRSMYISIVFFISIL